MRTLYPLTTERNPEPEARAPALGQLLVRVEPNAIVVFPLILDRAQAVRCYARLQALVDEWAEDPQALKRICEVDAAAVGQD